MRLEANGVSGSLVLDGDRLILKKKGWPYGHKSEKTIPLRSITATQWKPAGLLTNGYIQIVYAGSVEKRGGVFDAAKDENSVMFLQRDQAAFDAIRAAIAAEGAAAPQSPGGSLADELGRLADLRDRGVLTEDEFASQKARLLG
jgi:hypothetical protein